MEVKFYNGKTLKYIRTLEEDIINANLTIGLHGSIQGDLNIEINDNNNTFISTLKKMSHFMKIKKETQTYGVIIESVFINNNIATINFFGFFEYLEHVIAIAPRKAGIIGTSSIPNIDNSWIENFYSDTPLGLYYAILKNIQEVMTTRGYTPNFDITQLIPLISMSNDQEWSRSYRVNSLEAKTVKSIITDILNDVEIEGLEVYVDNSNTFKWIIKPITTYEVVSLNESTDDIFDIEFGEDDSVSASYSILTGTALNGDDLISTLPFDETVAFSTFIVENPVEKTSDIGRLNSQGQQNEKNKKGQLTFSSYNDDLKLLTDLTISSNKLGIQRGIINEYIIENNKVSYTMQLIDGTVNTGGLRKPLSISRKIMFNPLNYSVDTSRGQVFKKNNAPTGWR